MNESDVRRLIDEFNAAWNDHDLEATVALVSDDFVFDSTGPAPDGERFVGPDGARRAWARSSRTRAPASTWRRPSWPATGSRSGGATSGRGGTSGASTSSASPPEG